MKGARFTRLLIGLGAAGLLGGLLSLSHCAGSAPVDPTDVCVRLPGCEQVGDVCCDESSVCSEQVCQGLGYICGVSAEGIYRWDRSAAPCDDGDPCTADDTCVGGQCQGEPQTCEEVPDSECVDANTLRTYGEGQCEPGVGCTYTNTDVTCPAGCSAGKCAGEPCVGVTCDQPSDSCHAKVGTCDPASGACSYAPLAAGTACDPGDACVLDAKCTAEAECQGTAKDCSAPHTSGGTCVKGACQGYKCSGDWGNCDNDWSDGCETNLATNVDNCGTCGKKCSGAAHATATCSAKACGIKCSAPWKNCNGNAGDGCEIPVGRANSCNDQGLSTNTTAGGKQTPGCGTPHCGAGSGAAYERSFGSWHCIFCIHCQLFDDGWAWCLKDLGRFSGARCSVSAPCGCPGTYNGVCTASSP